MGDIDTILCTDSTLMCHHTDLEACWTGPTGSQVHLFLSLVCGGSRVKRPEWMKPAVLLPAEEVFHGSGRRFQLPSPYFA